MYCDDPALLPHEPGLHCPVEEVGEGHDTALLQLRRTVDTLQ